MTDYTPEIAYKAAAKGAKLMDQLCPGWTLLLDVQALELEEPSMCILGQTAHCVTKGESESGHFYSYQSALDRVVEEVNKRRRVHFTNSIALSIENGFCIVWEDDMGDECGEQEEENEARWEMLNIAWRQEISNRSGVTA